MSSLVATLVLILVALLGARFSFSTETVPPGPRLLFRTGTHFLLVGFALGPAALGLLTPEATRGLFPFLALGLGWVGFHFGLQLGRDSLRLFPPRYFLFAAGQALLTFALFAAGAHVAARALGLEGDLVPLLVLGAACTAAVTTPAAIGMVSSTFQVKGKIRDLLFFVGSLDAAVGITALQVTYALYRPESVAEGPGTWSDLRWVAAAAALGTVCGIVFLWLSRGRPTQEEVTLYLLGISAFAAGVALQWDLSPLFVSVVMGAVVANSPSPPRRVLPILQRWEKMVYVTFLLLAGALLAFPTWVLLPVALGYAVLRFAAKTVASGVMVAVTPLRHEVPRRIGLGLIPQGGISIAMAVSGVLMYSELRIAGIDAEASLFAVIVLGVVLSELVGPFLTVAVLSRAGEMPTPPAAPARAATGGADATRTAARSPRSRDSGGPDD